MRWYKKLYLGEVAAKTKYKIFGRIRRSVFTNDTFLIVLSENNHNLLDIISANTLKQPYYKKKGNLDRIYVVGLAVGHNEALEVVRNIIDELYTSTGGFDIRGYLKFGQVKQQ